MTILILRSSVGGGGAPATFDYYIGPSGSDSNDGLTTGTPWAITAINTKRATYSPSGVGKTIGFLDGTYDVHSLLTSNRDTPGLDIEGGTSGAPVILKSVNPRGAIISGFNGSTYGNGITSNHNSIFGHTPSRRQGYITLDGFAVTGFRCQTFEFGIFSSTPSLIPGITVKNCYFYDNDIENSTTGLNPAFITMNKTIGSIVENNRFEDLIGQGGAGSSDHIEAVLYWLSYDMVFRYNTIRNAGPVYAKEGPQGGGQVYGNYIDNSGISSCAGIYDFVTQSGTGGTTNIYNNLVRANQCIYLIATLSNTAIPVDTVNAYNNTIVIENSTNACGLAMQGQPSVNSIYNNLFYLGVGANPADEGFTLIRDGILSVMDYNIYPSTNQQWKWFTSDKGSRSGTSSFATAKSHYGGDANSPAPTNTPGFAGSGTEAAFYNVSSGTAFNAGHVGGVSGGAAINIGFDSRIGQRGCDFASARY